MTKKRFKKIYLEIINYCNLKCPFCVPTNHKPKMMTLDELNQILPKIKDYTDYVYLHLKGEPLMHPDLGQVVKLIGDYGLKVNLTTNGFLLPKVFDELKQAPNIYQLNLSLQSLITQSSSEQERYLKEIIPLIKELDNHTNIYMSLRLWNDESKEEVKSLNEMILKFLGDYFKVEILSNYHGQQIGERIYLSKEEEFTWPRIIDRADNHGYCLGGKTHLGVLADGTVTICCLDHLGLSNLGNLFEESLEEILKKDHFTKIVEGFKERKNVLPLCKSCTYRYRFNK